MSMTSALVGALSGSPILTLLVVMGLGFLLGEVSVFGFRFGVAGVLFAGLAMGSQSPLITLPEVVPTLGLVLFVYAIGVSSGRGFFDAFRRQGYRDHALAAGFLSLAALGKRIRELEPADRLSAIIPRLRRGDVDVVPDAETKLEYGDRVRVLTRRSNFAAIAGFFGDSVRGTAELHVGSLAIGMVLGVVVGMLPIPFGGGRTTGHPR